jgi:acyl transferase domain-containing protein
VAAQLAGLLVLAAAGSKSAGPHHPMLESAQQLLEEAHDAIQCVRVPKRAQRHHDSLLRAAAALQQAAVAAHRSAEIDPVLLPLREAYAHLERASNELPGFPMVAFEQGCCGRAS